MPHLNGLLRFALRALLVAVWASTALIAPAHALLDDVQDPCQQEMVSADHDGLSSDLDKEFHAAHGCGSCHAHAFMATAPQGLKLAMHDGASRIISAHQVTSFPQIERLFRPPRA